LQVASISDIKIADSFTPALSAADLDAIVDCLNHVLDSSELSLTPPGGDLQTIDIIDDSGTPKLRTTWSGGDTVYVTASEIEDKLTDMADTLAAKANSYLGAESPDWTARVVAEDGLLKVTVELSLFGRDATLHTEFGFSGLDFSFADATLSVGAKTVTFSGSGDIGATDYIPWLEMETFSLNDDHPGLRDFIADNEDALLDAIDDMVETLVDNTGTELAVRAVTSVAVEGADVVVTGACLVEGDVTLDGRTNIIDAMFIAQYTVGLRELDACQCCCGDTTDDGTVNIVDAMHIAQFTVDPRGAAGVLFKPLWECDCDEGRTIDPLTV
ncbi:MAG: dockerin type I repeat-containing protein, partial [Armatimonadetes bacterium]|nr:dockerin type I repeat-containing protein [Armatimonadota bacterium]